MLHVHVHVHVPSSPSRCHARARQASAVTGDGGGDGGATDPFARTMAHFSSQSSAEVTRLTGRLSAAEAAYAELLAYLRVPPKGGKQMETDELFSIFVEFGEAVRAVAPKPKAPAKASKWKALAPSAASGAASGADAHAHATGEGAPPRATPRASQAAPADSAEPLDPMLSRMRGLSVAAGSGPVRASRRSVADNQPPSRLSVADRPTPVRALAKSPDAVDRKLQERLAARFERAQQRASRLSRLDNDG